MGHDIHFLHRLERLSLPHVELAMSLYNDTPLLQFILNALRLPEGTERLALSLTDAERGPFLVVQRNGHFVTCLGEGMLPSGLHVVSYAQLEGIASRAHELRRRMEIAKEARQVRGGKSGRAVNLFRPLMVAGPNLSREDFVAAAAWAPTLIPHIQLLILDFYDDIRRLRMDYRRARRGAPIRELARLYWNLMWAIGHLTMLVGLDGRDVCELVLSSADTPLTTSFTWPAMAQGVLGLSLRAAWTAGRLGKAILPNLKASWDLGGCNLGFHDAVFGMVALGARHRGLRAEIRKFLQRHTEPPKAKSCGPLFRVMPQHLPGVFDELMAAVDTQAGQLQKMAAVYYVERLAPCMPEGHPLRFTELDAVPPEYVLPAVAMLPILVTDAPSFTSLVTMVCACARAEAEDLYFPASFFAQFHLPWHVDLALPILEELAPKAAAKTVRAAPRPGRNDPCPCGSGAKYKKCCETRAEPPAPGH